VQIASIQQQIETAKSEKLRIERLLKSNAANQKQLDDVIAQISILEKQLEAQKSSLDITNRSIGGEISAIEIQVAQLNDQLKKCKISSPINGTVLVKYAEKGEFTAMGKPLFKIADTGNMFLRAYVTSDQLTKLKIGESIKVFADFGESENKEYTGTITWISSKSEFTPKTIQTQNERANLVYAIKVAVKNDGYLKIGMYGNIKIAPPAP
jgi:HlyD family secretion protein